MLCESTIYKLSSNMLDSSRERWPLDFIHCCPSVSSRQMAFSLRGLTQLATLPMLRQFMLTETQIVTRAWVFFRCRQDWSKSFQVSLHNPTLYLNSRRLEYSEKWVLASFRRYTYMIRLLLCFSGR